MASSTVGADDESPLLGVRRTAGGSGVLPPRSASDPPVSAATLGETAANTAARMGASSAGSSSSSRGVGGRVGGSSRGVCSKLRKWQAPTWVAHLALITTQTAFGGGGVIVKLGMSTGLHPLVFALFREAISGGSCVHTCLGSFTCRHPHHHVQRFVTITLPGPTLCILAWFTEHSRPQCRDLLNILVAGYLVVVVVASWPLLPATHSLSRHAVLHQHLSVCKPTVFYHWIGPLKPSASELDHTVCLTFGGGLFGTDPVEA